MKIITPAPTRLLPVRLTGGRLRLTLSLSVGFLILIGMAGAGGIVCNYCDKEIIGQYIQADGKFYHPDHFRCTVCGKNIGAGRYFTEKGKVVCESCYHRDYAPRCRQCGQPIKGEYIIQDDFHYHKDCYDKYIALKCALCGRTLSGKYLIDHWGNNYCQSHETAPRCDYCGRYIGDRLTLGGETYSDGRHVCGICLRSAITDEAEAERIMKETISRLSGRGILIKDKNISLHLVDKYALKSIGRAISDRHAGYVKYEYKKPLIGSKKETFDIYILIGMPEYDYISAVAHELMHVWLFQQKTSGHDDALAEGSCNYASYLVMSQITGDYPEFIIDNLFQDTHPYYGEGFRRVHKLVESKGLRGWLELLQNSLNFPKGY